MPPRPAMSDSTPAPILKAPPPATAVRVARALWLTSIIVATAAVVFSFLSRGDQLAPFADVVAQVQPQIAASDREPIAAAIIIGTLGALAVVLLAETLLVRVMVVKARGGARWGLLAAVVVNAVVCAIAGSFATSGQYGVLSGALLVAQLVLACAALVAGFAPSASGWFRRENETRRGGRAVT